MLLDILTEDQAWSAWSEQALAECAEHSALAINPLIYANRAFHGAQRLDAVAAT